MENEKKLLILLSRVTFSDKDIEEIRAITKNPISWCDFFCYALKNKVVALTWHNINMLDIRHIPKYIKQIMNCAVEGQREQNRIFMEEKNNILNELNKQGVICIPVKGAMLVDLLYHTYGIRTLGDLDFLIAKTDESSVDSCMKRIGYIKGNYNLKTNTITPVERKEDIKWKVGATNVYPYVKLVDNEHMKFVKVDFRHSLDETLNKQPVNEIIDYYKKNGEVNPLHIILHLAAHMYHEAIHSMSVLYNKDINLIKFCDIREYIVQRDVSVDFGELVELSHKYSLEKALYYAFYYLKEIYSDGYEDEVLNKLEDIKIEEVDMLYDEKDKKSIGWKKSFFDRMFASNNFDEISEVKYEMNKTF